MSRTYTRTEPDGTTVDVIEFGNRPVPRCCDHTWLLLEQHYANHPPPRIKSRTWYCQKCRLVETTTENPPA